MVLAPAAASAHGLGGRADLPVPVGYFAAGAGVVVVVSFVMVSALWTSPRLQGTEIDTEATPQPNRLGSVLRIVGLVLFSLVVITGLADGTASALNVTPVLVLVGFWLVVPFLAPLVGDWWRWLSPWGLLSRHLNASAVERPDLVDRFGVLPATLSLFAFTWLELVSPDSSDPRTLAVAALV
ncbi:MAG: fenitrothion hydrolase, partial [Actinomycetota bacterium]|nr:fenitrothion hydrolase [Actinomycetota bacterium]